MNAPFDQAMAEHLTLFENTLEFLMQNPDILAESEHARLVRIFTRFTEEFYRQHPEARAATRANVQ